MRIPPIAKRFTSWKINLYPIGSMYGIYANIWGILMVNVTIYSIHGSYGYIAIQVRIQVRNHPKSQQKNSYFRIHSSLLTAGFFASFAFRPNCIGDACGRIFRTTCTKMNCLEEAYASIIWKAKCPNVT